jgi:hypothetical protein
LLRCANYAKVVSHADDMERGDPLPWLAVAIEEEAVGLEHSTRTSCMGSGQM